MTLIKRKKRQKFALSYYRM